MLLYGQSIVSRCTYTQKTCTHLPDCDLGPCDCSHKVQNQRTAQCRTVERWLEHLCTYIPPTAINYYFVPVMTARIHSNHLILCLIWFSKETLGSVWTYDSSSVQKRADTGLPRSVHRRTCAWASVGPCSSLCVGCISQGRQQTAKKVVLQGFQQGKKAKISRSLFLIGVWAGARRSVLLLGGREGREGGVWVCVWERERGCCTCKLFRAHLKTTVLV